MSVEFFVRLLGRRRAWRLGRTLYMAARGEFANDMETNGETQLIRSALDAFARAGAPGRFVAVDIGANLGLWSGALLEAARVRNVPCAIELFEPAPGAFALLSSRFSDTAETRLHAMAISDRSGIAELQVIGDFAGTNSLVATGEVGATALTVPVATLGEMKERLALGELHLVKIDAEGHDLDILRGMIDLLRRREVGIVQFEYNWRWLMNGGSLRAVFGLVRDLDYRIGRLTRDGLEIYRGWNAENDRFFESNYALVRGDVLARLPHRELSWDESNLPLDREGLAGAAR